MCGLLERIIVYYYYYCSHLNHHTTRSEGTTSNCVAVSTSNDNILCTSTKIKTFWMASTELELYTLLTMANNKVSFSSLEYNRLPMVNLFG